jgi:broad specificity phosphatase PhoE
LARRPVTTRLLLVRHGETDWNRLGRWHGQADVSLNAAGREQANALRNRLRNERLAAVYSSALRRSVETAHIVAAQFKLNVSRDARLNEINLGSWEGLARKEIAARFPELLKAWEADPQSVRPPFGETIAELKRRALEVTEEIAQAYPGETVCLVGHKVTNGVIRSHYLGVPLVEALQGVPEHAVLEVVELPYPFL